MAGRVKKATPFGGWPFLFPDFLIMQQDIFFKGRPLFFIASFFLWGIAKKCIDTSMTISIKLTTMNNRAISMGASKASTMWKVSARRGWTSFILCTICMAFCFASCTAGVAGAESEGAGTGPPYIESIHYDDEGNVIRFPSFVMAEPVMNEIYVIDSMNRIIVYTSDLFPLLTITGRNGIENPTGVAVDKDGNVYVTQSSTKEDARSRIVILNACLKKTREIFFQGFEGASSFVAFRIALDKKGLMYVAGLSYPGVIVLDNQGRFLKVLAPMEGDRTARISGVTIDKGGRIYLLSEDESRIYVYDENYKFLFKFGEKGGSSGKLSRPKGIAVDDANGKIYVSDYMRHSVNIYDKEGKYLSEFGGMGWGEGWFQHPMDIAVDSNGRILVADTFNDRIQLFKSM